MWETWENHFYGRIQLSLGLEHLDSNLIHVSFLECICLCVKRGFIFVREARSKLARSWFLARKLWGPVQLLTLVFLHPTVRVRAVDLSRTTGISFVLCFV